MDYPERFDVIVIGGGHAGTEACLAAARLGCKTLLLTHNVETLGQMSCNPAIGGIGKSHLVKEVDALGGAMALATDLGGIQFRVLNASKGPAVRATRAQADRVLYKAAIRSILENQPNLSIFQQAVDDLIMDGERVCGAVSQTGIRFYAKTVVLCTGTFLGGKIHIGLENHGGGRAGDPPSNALAQRLREMPFRVDRLKTGIRFYAKTVVLCTGTFLGGKIHIGLENHGGGRAGDPPSNALAKRLREMPFRVDRLKTGTPPRIDARSVNFDGLQQQWGDQPIPVMSFIGNAAQHPQQTSCWITHTNEQTHDIIRGGLDRSPMYTGVIEGIGPRYCPSIEDKIHRFAEKNTHQVFIEPEGLNTHELYPNGISTSLPFDVQLALVRSIKGFENAFITRPGYAIEYDFFNPQDLLHSLETRFVPGLFFAGQINGTTGYEEAAAQGLLAGINAGLQALGRDAWYPRRDEAYIGVLVDDLITLGTREPYRMFTSRAEYRLLLREDNADLRLTETGYKLGLIDDQRWRLFSEKREAITVEQQRLASTWVQPQSTAAAKLNALIEQPITHEYNLLDLLKRPELNYAAVVQLVDATPASFEVGEQIEIQAKYAGYIDRQTEEIERLRRYEDMSLPVDLDFAKIEGLSNEVKLKLNNSRPGTLGQASRIPGVTPAAVSLLLIYLKKRGLLDRPANGATLASNVSA